MKGLLAAFSPPLRRLTTRPTTRWTCAECLNSVSRPKASQGLGARFFASRAWSSSKTRAQKGRKGVLLLASGGGAAATGGVLAFTDDIKYGYDATERAGRVAAALAVCINEYVPGPPYAGPPAGN